MAETIKLIYSAAKVRLGFLIMLCALAGLAVTPGGDLSGWQVMVLGITVLLCSASAGAFNQWRCINTLPYLKSLLTMLASTADGFIFIDGHSRSLIPP